MKENLKDSFYIKQAGKLSMSTEITERIWLSTVIINSGNGKIPLTKMYSAKNENVCIQV